MEAELAGNDSPEFVGVERLKQKHRQQVGELDRLAALHEWEKLRAGHFDWWTFPTDSPSGQMGWKYVVGAEEIAALQMDTLFMWEFRLGLVLVARAWGWDLENGISVRRVERGQHWDGWSVRLYKMLRSALLFNCLAEARSLQAYGRRLLKAGEKFEYAGHDLSELFLTDLPKGDGLATW